MGERGDLVLEGAEDMRVRFPGNLLHTAMIIEKDAILNGIPMICLENAQRMFTLLVGLGARTLHLTIYPIRSASKISLQS